MVWREFRISLATVYNTLHQFERVGLVRAIAVAGTKRLFDVNTQDHAHIREDTGELSDIGDAVVHIVPPPPPEGYEILTVDALIRVRPHDAKKRSGLTPNLK